MATTSKKTVTKKKTSKKKSTSPATAKKKVSGAKKTATKKTAAKKTTKKSSVASQPDASSIIDITREERWKMVAVAAYHKAEQRGFAPGHELQDWTESEQEIDAFLSGR